MKTRTVRSKGGRSGKTTSAKSLFSLPLRGVLCGIGIAAAAVLDSAALGTWLAALPDDFCPFLARFGEDGVGVVGVAMRRGPEAWRLSPSLPVAGVLRLFCGAGMICVRAVVWVCASEGVWGRCMEEGEKERKARRRERERGDCLAMG